MSPNFQFRDSSQLLRNQIQLGYLNIGNNYYPLFNTGSGGSFRSLPATVSLNQTFGVLPGVRIDISGITFTTRYYYVSDADPFVGYYTEDGVGSGGTYSISNMTSSFTYSAFSPGQDDPGDMIYGGPWNEGGIGPFGALYHTGSTYKAYFISS